MLPARKHSPLAGHSFCSFAFAFDASSTAVIIIALITTGSFDGNLSHPAPQPLVNSEADHEVIETSCGHIVLYGERVKGSGVTELSSFSGLLTTASKIPGLKRFLCEHLSFFLVCF